VVAKAHDETDNISAKAPRDALALDYQWTNEQIKLLTDIRFRLLALLPPLVAIAVTVLSSATLGGPVSPVAMVGVGILGFFITLGAVIYDLRNSQLYDAHLHRAALIERALGMATLSKLTSSEAYGGPHALRMRPKQTLFTRKITHGEASGLIYGTVLAAWAYPIVKGLCVLGGMFLSRPADFLALIGGGTGMTTTFIALFVAVFAAILMTRHLINLDQKGRGRAEEEVYGDVNKVSPQVSRGPAN
jgi:hypothetical protein